MGRMPGARLLTTRLVPTQRTKLEGTRWTRRKKRQAMVRLDATRALVVLPGEI
jgi:hypothetical protein